MADDTDTAHSDQALMRQALTALEGTTDACSTSQQIAGPVLAAIDALRTRLGSDGWQTNLGLAVIGRKHFGNPIPREWYTAAKDLLLKFGIK